MEGLSINFEKVHIPPATLAISPPATPKTRQISYLRRFKKRMRLSLQAKNHRKPKKRCKGLRKTQPIKGFEKELQYLYTNPTLKYHSFIIILSSPNITWKHMMVSVENKTKSAMFEGCVKIISWVSLALLTKQKNAFRVLGNKKLQYLKCLETK